MARHSIALESAISFIHRRILLEIFRVLVCVGVKRFFHRDQPSISRSDFKLCLLLRRVVMSAPYLSLNPLQLRYVCNINCLPIPSLMLLNDLQRSFGNSSRISSVLPHFLHNIRSHQKAIRRNELGNRSNDSAETHITFFVWKLQS